MNIPFVKNSTKQGIENIDIMTYSFLKKRDIFISEPIVDDLVAQIIVQLQYLDNIEEGDIHLWINSPGGSVTAGLAIYDAIKCCKNDVVTICTGMAASMGAFLLAAGTKGKRYATPESEIMIHQPIGGAQGQASDIEVMAQHIARTKNRLNNILAEACGKPVDLIARDTDRDYWLSAKEALEYGLIDDILKDNF